MKCTNCPVAGGGCLGEHASRLCELAAMRPDYRRLLMERANSPVSPPRAGTMQESLSAIAACADRGSVLPHSLQPECGCAELTECRNGRGRIPGRVTLRDCLACICSRPISSAPNPTSIEPPLP